MTTENPEAHSFWKNPLTIILGTIVLFLTAQLIGMMVIAPFEGSNLNDNYKMGLYVAGNLFVLWAALTILMRLLGFTWRHVGVNKVAAKKLLMVVPAFLLYFAVSMTLTAIASKVIPGFDVDQAQDVGFTRAGGLQLFVTFLSLVVFTPVLEEIIFRGILFRGLRIRLPFWAAAVITSVLFGLAHMQLNVAVDTLALSLTLCYLSEKYNSILPAILLHALKNGLAFVLLFVFKV